MATLTNLDPHQQGPDPDHLPPHEPAKQKDPYLSPDKKVMLTLSWIPGLNAYEIIGVTNTSYYKPKQWLYEAAVKKLEQRPGWEFSVTSPDYLAMFLGLASKMVSLPILAAPVL